MSSTNDVAAICMTFLAIQSRDSELTSSEAQRFEMQLFETRRSATQRQNTKNACRHKTNPKTQIASLEGHEAPLEQDNDSNDEGGNMLTLRIVMAMIPARGPQTVLLLLLSLQILEGQAHTIIIHQII